MNSASSKYSISTSSLSGTGWVKSRAGTGVGVGSGVGVGVGVASGVGLAEGSVRGTSGLWAAADWAGPLPREGMIIRARHTAAAAASRGMGLRRRGRFWARLGR